VLFLQYDLPFVTFFVVRYMTFNTIDVCNVFAILTSSTGSTVMLHGWMIFCIKITPRLLIAYKGCMTVMLAVRILISRLRFFKLSRMIGDFTNDNTTDPCILPIRLALGDIQRGRVANRSFGLNNSMSFCNFAISVAVLKSLIATL
jgi:hypothetical protein